MLIPNLRSSFEKQRNFGREKSNLLKDAGRDIFSVIVPKRPSKAIKKSEMHLVICEIAFSVRNTLKKLFEVEFWLVLDPNTQKAGFWAL
jgi:hypothetical protein